MIKNMIFVQMANTNASLTQTMRNIVISKPLHTTSSMSSVKFWLFRRYEFSLLATVVDSSVRYNPFCSSLCKVDKMLRSAGNRAPLSSSSRNALKSAAIMALCRTVLLPTKAPGAFASAPKLRRTLVSSRLRLLIAASG